MKKALFSFVAVACLGCGGCGSSNYSGNGGGTPTPLAVAGKWQIISSSTQNPGGFTPYAAIETNLTQTGTSIFSGNLTSVVIPFGAQGIGPLAPLNPCGGIPQAVINGSISGQDLSFTLTQTGPSGSYIINGTATVSPDAQTIMGSYTAAAACGAAADAGTFSGTFVPTINGTYATAFNTGPGPTMTITEDSSQGVTATGSYQGANFSLSGRMIGGTLTVSGNIPGLGFVIFVADYLNPPLVSLMPAVNGVSTQAGEFVIFGPLGSIGLATKQ
jgi:hypothetical protein